MPSNEDPSATNPAEKLAGEATKKIEGQADRVIGNIFRAWWAKADSDQKAAATALILAVVAGPIGLATVKPLVSRSIGFNEVKAAGLLLLITLPVSLAAAVFTAMFGKIHVMAVLALAAGAAFAVGSGMINTSIPKSLGNLYCYASIEEGNLHFGEVCRDFDEAGFIRDNAGRLGKNSGSVDILSSAFVYTADARGNWMAFWGLIGGGASGILIRRWSSSS